VQVDGGVVAWQQKRGGGANWARCGPDLGLVGPDVGLVGSDLGLI
jgi:hypothetical protein